MVKFLRSVGSLWTLVGSAVLALFGYLADISDLMGSDLDGLWGWTTAIALLVFFAVLIARDVVRQEQVEAIQSEMSERRNQDDALTLIDSARAILRRNADLARTARTTGRSTSWKRHTPMCGSS